VKGEEAAEFVACSRVTNDDNDNDDDGDASAGFLAIFMDFQFSARGCLRNFELIAALRIRHVMQAQQK